MSETDSSVLKLSPEQMKCRSDRLDRAFHAYDVRALVPDDLDADLARDIARAFSDFLPEGTVAVGRDMRTDSSELADAFIEGLMQQGREVLDIGMVTTDMSYWAVGHYDLAGAAMITASHNPGKYDGIKFTAEGAVQLSSESGLTTIKEAVKKHSYKKASGEGRKLEKNILSDWVEHALHFVGGELAPLKIAIDAGNGMGSIIVPKLQEMTSLEISGLFMELDGTFPNHPANPLLPGATDDLITHVTRNELACGIAFDGDGDRCFFVDEKGDLVSASELGALLATVFLKENPKSTVVTNVVTGDIVHDTVEALGGTTVRSKVGHSIVQGVMRKNNAIFGAEHSGHFYYRDNFYCDSALITAVMTLGIISDTGKTLSELIKPFRKYAHTPEENIKVRDTARIMAGIKHHFSNASTDKLDGLTLRMPDWWASIRPSNTEPFVRVNIEAKNKTVLNAIQKELSEVIRQNQA